jgi:hypothetical protein
MVIHVVTTKPSLLVTINDAGWGTPSDAYIRQNLSTETQLA